MTLSYAGVSLPVLTPEASAAIESRIPTVDMNPWGQAPAAVGRGGFGLAAKKWNDRPPRIGHLSWPTGASKWATGYFLATDTNLEDIREAIGTPYGPAPLVIGDGTNSITAQMSMLMARPLLGSGAGSELWMLALVDQRYFWWTAIAGTTYVNKTYGSGSNPYYDLLNYLPGTVNFSYDTPAIPAPGLLIQPRDPIPPLLDWMAFALGQQIVVDLAGKVHAYNVSTSQSLLSTNLKAANPLVAGGALDLSTTTSNDLPALLPESVRVDFLPALYDPDAPTNSTSETVSFSSLNLLPGAETNNTTMVFSMPSPNPASLTVAQTWATSFYQSLLSTGDYVFAGIDPWTPTGLESYIDWEYNQCNYGVKTRVHRLVLEYTDELPPPPKFTYLIGTNTNNNSSVSPVPYGFPGIIGLSGRVLTDVTLSTTVNPTYINSASGNFTSADIGTILLGSGIANCIGNAGDANPLAFPPTKITAINSPTQAVMSAAATANVTNGTVGVVIQWSLANQMKHSRFNSGSGITAQDVWPDTGFSGTVYMVAERDGGLDQTFSIPTRLYNELINGMFVDCERVYRAKLVGSDLFGVPIYEARVEPMWWWWTVPNGTTTSTITLEGDGATVTAYSLDVLQYHSSGGHGFQQNLSSPVTNGVGYWYDATGNGATPPIMNGVILSRQVDCTTTGVPVFSGWEGSPTTVAGSGTSYSLTTPFGGQTTGISITLSLPGIYLVTCVVPGYLLAKLTHNNSLDNSANLVVWVQNPSDSNNLGGNHYTICSLQNPTSTDWPNFGGAYGTVTITGFVTITTAAKTLTLYAKVAGDTADVSTAKVGINADGSGEVYLQATQIH